MHSTKYEFSVIISATLKPAHSTGLAVTAQFCWEMLGLGVTLTRTTQFKYLHSTATEVALSSSHQCVPPQKPKGV